jgi:Flp pilus assembly protein TadD
MFCFALAGRNGDGHSAAASSPPAGNGRSGAANAASDAGAADPAKLFQRGQDALTQGQLDEAERSFRGVRRANPRSGAAYANLGVVYMRRRQWTKALESLQKAQQLLPQVAGILAWRTTGRMNS